MKKNELSFETAMSELEDILGKLSDSDISLDESIELYSRAAELIKICNHKLSKATVRIQEIDDKIAEMGSGDDL